MKEKRTVNFRTAVSALIFIPACFLVISCAGVSQAQNSTRTSSVSSSEKEAVYYAVLAAAAMESSDYDSAVKLMKLSVESAPYAEKAEYKKMLGSIYTARAKDYLGRGYVSNAVSDLESAFPLVRDWEVKREIGDILGKSYALRSLAKVKNGDIDGAIYDMDKGIPYAYSTQLKENMTEAAKYLRLIRIKINEGQTGKEAQMIQDIISVLQ